MLSPGGRTRRSLRAVVHGYQKMKGHSILVVRKLLDAHHLGDILAIHWIVRGNKRKRHKNAHALIVVFAAALEIDAFFRSVDADGKIFKMVVTRFGRTHP